eukprot:TRINITY_DN476_c0_g5_i1.p1 TRINITY_DN476_c0_g5~~TRINITY_DN476_c0_g5_i1.p1  ORF type:complete len:267 (+),score=50.76 TRINITY_DN476_c0_g5_i1:110-910(+)
MAQVNQSQTQTQTQTNRKPGAAFSLFGNTTKETARVFLRALGVSLKRIPKLLREIHRKIFHNYGLLIPAIYYAGVRHGALDQSLAASIVGTLAAALFVFECVRLYLVPEVNDLFARHFSFLMRKGESNRFTGMPFYMGGAYAAIYLSPPILSVVAILFLIFGDAAAAFAGISYGRTKIGRKSLEGSLAMFATCFVTSLICLYPTPFCDQLSFYGALAATILELVVDRLPIHVDDNFAIPFVSALTLRLTAWRFGVDHAHYQFAVPS